MRGWALRCVDVMQLQQIALDRIYCYIVLGLAAALDAHGESALDEYQCATGADIKRWMSLTSVRVLAVSFLGTMISQALARTGRGRRRAFARSAARALARFLRRAGGRRCVGRRSAQTHAHWSPRRRVSPDVRTVRP